MHLSPRANSKYNTKDTPRVKNALYIMNERIELVRTAILEARREDTPKPCLEQYLRIMSVMNFDRWF